MDPGLSFRECMSQLPTGVSVVTLNRAGSVQGTTVGSLTSVSLDPPLVLVSLHRRSRLAGRMHGAEFGVNVLSARQADIAQHFAGRAESNAPLRWMTDQPAPRLGGCVAFLHCAPWRSYDGGDHILYLGRVLSLAISGGDPLIFHRSRFGTVSQTVHNSAWIGSFDDPDHSTMRRTLTAHATERSDP